MLSEKDTGSVQKSPFDSEVDLARRKLLLDGAKVAAGIYLRGKIMPDLTEMAQVATGSVAKLLNARMGIVNRGAEESSEGVNVRALPDQSQQLDDASHTVLAQTRPHEQYFGEARVPLHPTRYHPAGKTLESPLRRFTNAHFKETGEDVTANINRFLEPWRTVTDINSGICNGAANWRSLQPEETPQGATLGRESLSGEEIDTIFGVWLYGAGHKSENIYDRPYPAEQSCGWGGPRSEPIFWHNLAWAVVRDQHDRVVIEVSTSRNQVWSYAVHRFQMSVWRLGNGLSTFQTRFIASGLLDSPINRSPELNFDVRYTINDEDMHYQGGYQSGTRINRAWTVDPRSYIVTPAGSYQMEGNVFTPSMLQSMRKLMWNVSDEKWAALITPSEQYPIHCS